MEPSSCTSNIWKIYVFRFLRDFYLIIPIIIPFYKSFHLTNTEILIIQAVFSLSLLFFEIPSGYFSDTLGRRITLVLGALAFPLGLGLYSISSSFLLFLVAETILGFGFAMCSGTESALIYDTLQEHGQTKRYQGIEGRAEFITRIGAMCAAVLGGWLSGFSLRLPFYLNAFSGILMFLIAVRFIEPNRKKNNVREAVLSGIIRVVKYCLRHRQILGLMLLYTAILTTGLISIWNYLLKLQNSNLPYIVNGIGFALFQGSSACGALASNRIRAWLGTKNTYRLLLLIPLLLFFQTLGHSQWLILLSLLHAFVWGLSTPFFLKEINILITSDIRATVLSTGSMFGRCFFVLLAPATGFISDQLSLSAAFLFLAAVFIAFAYFAERLLKRF